MHRHCVLFELVPCGRSPALLQGIRYALPLLVCACSPQPDIIAEFIGSLEGDAGSVSDVPTPTMVDAAPADSMRDPVLAPSDASIAPPAITGDAADAAIAPCSRRPPSDSALVIYEFEDEPGANLLEDSQGTIDGLVLGGVAAFVQGPEGCGQAFDFGESDRFFVIPANELWELEQGAVDFWFRVPESADKEFGIFSRDTQGIETPGHMAFWLALDQTVVARVQGATSHSVRCSSEPLQEGSWVYVGYNFGPNGTELWVNGVLAERTGPTNVPTIIPDCGTQSTDGIVGNQLPWVGGFDTSRTTEPLRDLIHHFRGGAIDSLRISSAPIDFDGFVP